MSKTGTRQATSGDTCICSLVDSLQAINRRHLCFEQWVGDIWAVPDPPTLLPEEFGVLAGSSTWSGGVSSPPPPWADYLVSQG